MWVQVTAEALEREGGSPVGRADSRAGGTPCSAHLRFRPPFGGGRERDGQGHGRASDVAGEGSVWPEKPRVGGEVHSGQNGGATSILHQAGSWQTQQAEGSPAVPEPQKHRWQQGLWSNGERMEPGERVPRGGGLRGGREGTGTLEPVSWAQVVSATWSAASSPAERGPCPQRWRGTDARGAHGAPRDAVAASVVQSSQ